MTLAAMSAAVELAVTAFRLAPETESVSEAGVWNAIAVETMKKVSANLYLDEDGRLNARAHEWGTDITQSEHFRLQDLVREFVEDRTGAQAFNAADQDAFRAIRTALEEALALLPPPCEGA